MGTRLSEILFITFTMVILFLPSTTMVLGIKPDVKSGTKQVLAEWPEFEADRELVKKSPIATWKASIKYFDGMKEYYEDHYGFRNLFINSYNVIITKYVKSVIKGKVIFGRENWLFWSGEDSLVQYRAFTPMTEDELKKFTRILEERHAWCEARGIRYLFVIPPNKLTVYPEYMPEGLTRTSEESHVDQFMEYVNKNSNVKVIHLKDILFRAKEKYEGVHPIFYKTGTHWNQLGAYSAYRAIIDPVAEWFPRIRPFELDDFTRKHAVIPGGDLAAYAGIQDQYRIDAIFLVPKKPRTARTVKLEDFYRENFSDKKLDIQDPVTPGIYVTEKADPSLPKAVMFRDSFANDLAPHLSEHFSRIVYFWYVAKKDRYDFNPDVIEHENPAIVINEAAERVFFRIAENAPRVNAALEGND